MKSNKFSFIVITLIVLVFFIGSLFNVGNQLTKDENNFIRILSSYDNRDLEEFLVKYAESEHISLEFTYMGDLDIVDELDNNSDNYDAVWIANSMWFYSMDNSSLVSNAKSISISPVVVGISDVKARSLGLVNSNITNVDVLDLIREKRIKYVMSSVTQTNTGATSYFGFLNTLAGNPEVLTEEMLENDNLINDLTSLFSGVERVSGDEDYLEEIFLNNEGYEAVIAAESSLININQKLEKKGREPLYLLYPIDGVPINDSTFAFIDHKDNKKDAFLKIQNYLLSNDGQKKLEDMGRRTWYGGVNREANQNVFRKEWGIDTNKYLNVTKFPTKKVMSRAINLYIEKLRKPTHVVFCLDYSGSMFGEGITELTHAMDYILDYNEAAKDKLQFSKNDKITVITFSDRVSHVWQTNSGYETDDLRKNIAKTYTGGGTALYTAINEGLNILSNESDDYTKTIIAMTDGDVNIGTFASLANNYQKLKSDVPIYSITFGSAVESQLEEIAKLSNARVFNGKTNLLEAFKTVRGYN